MTFNTIIIIAAILFALVLLGSCAYIYFRNKTLEEIRGDVYQLFLKAEHMYKESGTGKQKMKWVISEARKLLPDWLQMFISDNLLYNVVEVWFQAVKDLLDDGKYNKSV